MTAGEAKAKPGLFSPCFPALCYIPRSGSAAAGSRGEQAAPRGSSPSLFHPGLASSWDQEPQICVPHLLKPALVQSQAQGSAGRGIPRMLRSIWSALRSLCPPGDVQPDLGRAATLPLPPSPCDASSWAVFLPFREKIAMAGAGVAGCFLFHSLSVRSKLDFKCSTSVLLIFPWIYGCTTARWAPAKFVLKRQKRVFPKQITGKSLID